MVNIMKVSFKKERMVKLSFCIAVTIFASTVLMVAQSNGINTKDQKAKEVVDASFRAIGGADKIGDIRSLVIKGTSNRLTSKNTTLSQRFETRILLPGSFVEITWLSDSGTRIYRGVSQGILIPPPPSAKPPGWDVYRTPDGELVEFTPGQLENLANNAVIAKNYDINTRLDWWTCFLIGTLMKTGPAPLTITSDSTHGVFTLAKNNDTLGEIEFDSKSGYPSVVRYKRPEHPNMPPPEILSELIDGGYPTYSEMRASDITMRFLDRFSFNDIMFPKVITIDVSTNERYVTELRIEEVQINPKLSLKDFEIPGK